MLFHRVGERRTGFDVASRLQDDGCEVLVLFLRAENVEALDERKAGVDHHRELTREDRQVLGGDLLADLPYLLLLGRGRFLLPGGRDPRHHDLLAAQRRDGCVHRVGGPLAADVLSAPRASRV